MTLEFVFEEHEEKVTPIRVANALIETLLLCKDFPEDGLKEIIAYLSVYTRYNKKEKK